MGQPVVQTIHRDPALFRHGTDPFSTIFHDAPQSDAHLKVLTGILRHYAMTLLQSTPKKQDLPKIRQQRSLVRGVNLRTNAHVISPASFAARKAYMVQAFQEGKFLAEPEMRGKPRPNPMSDPAAMEGMMGMMKGQMTMMIPQTLIMGWINAFFSGFVISKSWIPLLRCAGLWRNEWLLVFQSLHLEVFIFSWYLGSLALECFNLGRIPLFLAPVYMRKRVVVDFVLPSHGASANQRYSTVKLPFPLTPQFKSMLQSGVGTRDLDVRWVSSLSWYFLTLFGLQPVYNFILGSNNAANQVSQQMAMANPGAGGMMGPEQDPDKLFLNEAENLEVLEHRWIMEGIEDRLVAKFGA
ncbi:hypothetical protein BM1_01319 [Bipolaris maydis]|nr:hypothetical protein BM1_01319 [Bipolaris maydis]